MDRSLLYFISLPLVVSGLLGCSTLSPDTREKDRELEKLQKRLTQANDKIEHLEEKNGVLQGLLGVSDAPPIVRAPSMAVVPSYSATRSTSLSQGQEQQVFSADVPRNNEKRAFQFILTAYKQKDRPKVFAGITALKKDFPNSVHLDNAYYLFARLNLEAGNYGEALRNFDRVIKDFPIGNKRPSSIYGKAQTYIKMNLPKMAKQAFTQLMNEYPDSLEAKRAEVEIRLIKDKA
ncbi:MAG: hypothetical protein CL677_04840 [Bdellovibrionaceae bacterium]|nr:hypothetical protein [Pseudobdellovibrionaceae bacterium]|tara:strand:- start:143592 stop:144293 length:702 start_codon:yes stop_codon:yes gene_type:complete